MTRSRGSQLSKHGQGWLSEQQAPGMLSEQQAPGMVSKEQEILVSTAEESFQFKVSGIDILILLLDYLPFLLLCSWSVLCIAIMDSLLKSWRST